MISVHLMGGLGNQLFQIFTAMAYGFDHDKKYVFQQEKGIRDRRKTVYWDNFLSSIKCITVTKQIQLPLYKETAFHYTQLPYMRISFMLYGYFQSYKYFNHQSDKIINILKIREKQIAIKERNERYFNEKTIALHFRIGDYVLPAHKNCHPLMPIEYYHQALDKIIKKTGENKLNVLCFCEKDDNKIVAEKVLILQKSFPTVTFLKANDKLEDWEQMLLMSCCDHNIIANSSFSWWGAYFNASREKVVCYPEQWFGPKLVNINDTKDLCPNSWNKIIL